MIWKVDKTHDFSYPQITDTIYSKLTPPENWPGIVKTVIKIVRTVAFILCVIIDRLVWGIYYLINSGRSYSPIPSKAAEIEQKQTKVAIKAINQDKNPIKTASFNPQIVQIEDLSSSGDQWEPYDNSTGEEKKEIQQKPIIDTQDNTQAPIEIKRSIIQEPVQNPMNNSMVNIDDTMIQSTLMDSSIPLKLEEFKKLMEEANSKKLSFEHLQQNHHEYKDQEYILSILSIVKTRYHSIPLETQYFHFLSICQKFLTLHNRFGHIYNLIQKTSLENLDNAIINLIPTTNNLNYKIYLYIPRASKAKTIALTWEIYENNQFQLTFTQNFTVKPSSEFSPSTAIWYHIPQEQHPHNLVSIFPEQTKKTIITFVEKTKNSMKEVGIEKIKTLLEDYFS
jgi:hypothetical protein